MEYVALNNGVKMPLLGYGVFQVEPGECERCVLDAIDVGYRLFDTAQSYYNEEGVGAAVKKCGLPREKLFLTTKVWLTNAGYDKAKASIEQSLEKLQTDYDDLVLIHKPFGDYYGAYRAMEEAYGQGKIKALGVSNFYPDRLIDIAAFSTVKPTVNQLETHVFQQRKIDRQYMAKHDCVLEAWGPFAEGKNGFFQNDTMREIGKKHGKSIAQVALRFLIQNGIAVIPKSAQKQRMAENFDVFDFVLAPEDMARLERMDTGKSLFFSHSDPETVERYMALAKQ